MNFGLNQQAEWSNSVDIIIRSSPISYFAIIDVDGLYKFSTSYPQPGIDYDRTDADACHRPKIVGVDEI